VTSEEAHAKAAALMRLDLPIEETWPLILRYLRIERREIMARYWKKKEPKARKCAQGHPLAGDNLALHLTKNGRVRRACRECNRVRSAEWKWKAERQREGAA